MQYVVKDGSGMYVGLRSSAGGHVYMLVTAQRCATRFGSRKSAEDWMEGFSSHDGFRAVRLRPREPWRKAIEGLTDEVKTLCACCGSEFKGGSVSLQESFCARCFLSSVTNPALVRRPNGVGAIVTALGKTRAEHEALSVRLEQAEKRLESAEHAVKAANALLELKTRQAGYQWWTWIAERADAGEKECKALIELQDAVGQHYAKFGGG